ncbi:phosphomevalonate kinase, partial [Elasticomyces elasticus]
MIEGPVAVSAPGKVLFAGGFLVLDRRHTGLVLGLDARIHVHVQEWKSTALTPLSDKHKFVLVKSPQFQKANWLYSVEHTTDGRALPIKQIADDPSLTQTRNKFVETTLQYVLTYYMHSQPNAWLDGLSNCQITILADENYYSQTDTIGPLKNGFRDFGCSLSDANKTGLGSSAALVTSLTSALIAFYWGKNSRDLSKSNFHNLAQAAHCAAQGKVGSGFDVAAAVYGSCLYKRFSPSILEAVGEPDSKGFAERLRLCVDELDADHKWDVEVSSRVDVPKSLQLVMCDVDCGSETPGM